MRQRCTFANRPASVPAARRFATTALTGLSAEVLGTVELLVSELATNCVRHTDSQFQLTIFRSRKEVRVEAMDEADEKRVAIILRSLSSGTPIPVPRPPI